MNNFLTEEILRINYISKYNLKKTSVENEIISEQGWRESLSLLRTDAEASRVFRSEIESILTDWRTTGQEFKAYTESGRELKTSSEILQALRDGRLTEESVRDVCYQVFKKTNNPKLIDSLAEDVVSSEKFINDYRDLTPKQIADKLEKSGMKLPKNSPQTKAIIEANAKAVEKDLKNFKDLEGVRGRTRYKNKSEWRDYSTLRSDEELAREYYYRYGDDISRDIRDSKAFRDKLKRAGLIKRVWSGTKGVFKWVFSVKGITTLVLLSGLAYGVYKVFFDNEGIVSDCPEGFTYDWTKLDCIKSGSQDDNEQNQVVTDEQGNVYKPCTGTYRINCVTKDIYENGIDYISQAQDCLGLPLTGKFNKDLENELYNKINKRTFTKNDIKYICMSTGTLAQL